MSLNSFWFLPTRVDGKECAEPDIDTFIQPRPLP